MKQKLIKYAIINNAGVYTLADKATVFTNLDVEIIDFENEQERNDYLIDNEIVIEE